MFLFSQRKSVGGVEVELCCEAPTWGEASVVATDTLIPPVLDVIAFHRKASMTLMSLTSALKSEPGSERRKVVLINERARPFELPAAWWINERNIEDINACLARDLPLPQNTLRWLRWAYRSLPIYEGFVYAWLALENLAGSRMVENKCSKCQKPLPPYRAADREAAYDIVNSFGRGIETKEFNHWWNTLRNSVFHGGKQPDSEFLGKLRAVTQRVIDGVEAGVQKKLNLNLEHRSTIALVPEQIFSRFHFIEFSSSNPAEEFASAFPSAEEIEAWIDSGSSHEERMNITLLTEKDFQGW
jgi:hypothetical protein